MFSCILVAIDVNDTEGASRASKAAMDLARSNSAPLHVLNVVPDMGSSLVGNLLQSGHHEAVMDQAKAALEEWALAAIPADVDAHLHVTTGTIYDRIIGAANELGADAIVVGAQRPALQDYLIGPNAARVVRHAKQSVFVVR